MLRAMFLPGKVTPDQTAFYIDLFKKVSETPEYKDYMEKQALKPIFLTGKDMVKFLEEDDKAELEPYGRSGLRRKVSMAPAPGQRAVWGPESSSTTHRSGFRVRAMHARND